MLERDQKAADEGSGVMLFQLLKSLLMILPQSTCYRVLRDRLVSVSRFRQSTIPGSRKLLAEKRSRKLSADTKSFVSRAFLVRGIHCTANWQSIRQESLEMPKRIREAAADEGADRRSWLGYASKQEQIDAEKALREGAKQGFYIEDANPKYHEFGTLGNSAARIKSKKVGEDEEMAQSENESEEGSDGEQQWKHYWVASDK